LGDTVVGDIGQLQCHTCTKKQKDIIKGKEERHLWHCGWLMSQCHQPQCHPSATRNTLFNPMYGQVVPPLLNSYISLLFSKEKKSR